MMQRRGFLGAMLAAGMAPAVVRSGVLMPVRPAIILPSMEIGRIEGLRFIKSYPGQSDVVVFRRWLPWGENTVLLEDGIVPWPDGGRVALSQEWIERGIIVP